MAEEAQQVPAATPLGHEGARVAIGERAAAMVTGWLGVALLLGCIAGSVVAAQDGAGAWIAAPVVVFFLALSGLVIVPPGQSRVVQFFGSYVGSVRRPGLWWVLPLTIHRPVSVRVRNFETSRLKVNDADGNPVEIAAIVVWQVADTAKAVYAVDDYPGFVSVQSEAALRHVATGHPYDDTQGTGTSLRGSTDVVAAQLAGEVAARIAIAGVEVVEVRISHLAYAPEIAQAMLRRQQRTPSSLPAPGSSKARSGWWRWRSSGWPNRKSSSWTRNGRRRWSATWSMVSNLMVVLCGDQPPSPVVNTGTLYS